MNGNTPGHSQPSPEHPDQPQAAASENRSTSTPPPDRTRWWCLHACPRYARPTGARRVYIPIYGWLDIDDDHRTRVDRFFHIPMLVLALLVLPLLLLEWYYGEHTEWAHPAIQHGILIAGVVIWLAFLVEFIIKVWIARSRWQYVTRNWLDIIIIALPMLRPLRGLRVVRAAQVARMSRVFTLRGVVMKLLRTAAATVIGLQFVRQLGDRFRGSARDEAPLAYEQWSRACLIAEIRRLNERIRRLEKQRGLPEDEKDKERKAAAQPPES